MFDNVRHGHVGLAPDGISSGKIPAHYGPYYDDALRRLRLFRAFGGEMGEIHENFWPIVSLMADQAKRIDDLEKMLSGGREVEVASPQPPAPPAARDVESLAEPIGPPDLPAVIKLEVVAPPEPIPKKVDRRTKAYKEAQKKLETVGV